MALPEAVRMNYSDYCLMPEDRRYELIDGDLFMTPAPTTSHQRILRNLAVLLHAHVSERGLGEVLPAPCDVVLTEHDVVQPDILFVAHEHAAMVTDAHVAGAPDLVVEILSLRTAARDRVAKAKLYARHGTRELWLVDPESRTIEIQVSEGGAFRRASLFAATDVLRSPLLTDLLLPLAQVFP